MVRRQQRQTYGGILGGQEMAERIDTKIEQRQRQRKRQRDLRNKIRKTKIVLYWW